jgi:ABC-type branched-subunit amino acid transport system permease subunit
VTPISAYNGYKLGSVLDLVILGGTSSLTGVVFGFGDFLYGGATLVLEYTPIPEASELWMLAAGLLAVGGIAVKRRSLGQV